MARLKELPDVTMSQMVRHNSNLARTYGELGLSLQERGLDKGVRGGFYTEAQQERAALDAALARAPGGLQGGILHHGTENEPGDTAAYPGHSDWPSFSHPPTPPPWGWRGHPPVWSWEIGWIFEAGFQMDWHMVPPEGWGQTGVPGGSTTPVEPIPPAGNTLPGVPSIEGDPMIIVLPRWQQPMGRYLTPNQEVYDSGVKPIKPVDSWYFGKLNYRLGAKRAMGRIT